MRKRRICAQSGCAQKLTMFDGPKCFQHKGKVPKGMKNKEEQYDSTVALELLEHVVATEFEVSPRDIRYPYRNQKARDARRAVISFALEQDMCSIRFLSKHFHISGRRIYELSSFFSVQPGPRKEKVFRAIERHVNI